MTIEWATKYGSISLYNTFNSTLGGRVSSQTQLTSRSTRPLCRAVRSPLVPRRAIVANCAGTSYEWTVDCAGDCSAPFTLHAVNAQGGSSELANRGFWSRDYWIRPASGDAISSSSSPASSPTRRHSQSVSVVARTSSTVSIMSRDAKTSFPARTSSAASQAPSRSPDDNSTAVGLGVGIGAGVGLLLAGAFFFWRRYHKRRSAAEVDIPRASRHTPWQHEHEDQQPSKVYEAHYSPRPVYEAKGAKVRWPVEAYQELPGHDQG